MKELIMSAWIKTRQGQAVSPASIRRYLSLTEQPWRYSHGLRPLEKGANGWTKYECFVAPASAPEQEEKT